MVLSVKKISSRDEVHCFLQELKKILNSKQFNIDADLDILLKKKTESPIDPYTTNNTLLALDYDKNDIVQQLLSLSIEEYIETFIDDKDSNLPPFYTFGKVIEDKDVYIKLKIRDKVTHKVFCVSFHFARYPLKVNRPYR